MTCRIYDNCRWNPLRKFGMKNFLLLRERERDIMICQKSILIFFLSFTYRVMNLKWEIVSSFKWWKLTFLKNKSIPSTNSVKVTFLIGVFFNTDVSAVFEASCNCLKFSFYWLTNVNEFATWGNFHFFYKCQFFIF